MRFKILPLIKANLSFQTPTMVRDKIRFKIISNKIMIVDIITSYKSCRK